MLADREFIELFFLTNIMHMTTSIYYVLVLLAHGLHFMHGPKPKKGRHGRVIYEKQPEFKCLSKTIQVMFMCILPLNLLVTLIYFGFVNDEITVLSYTFHILPLAATFIEFIFNRIAFEHNLAWAPTLFMIIYGFCICYPYTRFVEPVYEMLSFDNPTAWLYSMACIATGPVAYFFFYGLCILKF